MAPHILSSGTGKKGVIMCKPRSLYPGKQQGHCTLRGFRSLYGCGGEESNPGYQGLNIMTQLSSLQQTLMKNTKYFPTA
jgi:hypothetical protein